jgi:hypothetical protein
MRNVMLVVAALVAGNALATLPPAPPEVKEKAAEAKAKADWSDKVGAYQLCLAQDRIAATYRKDQKAAGKTPPPGTAAPCVEPGPYATPVAQKPLEASGAHSPTETAKSPPSTNAPAANSMGKSKP